MCAGAIAPNVPIIEQTRPGPTDAIISWTVRAIAYTSESYHIEYGLDENSLIMESEIINGTLNFTSSNLMYLTTITNLQPFTQYYYRVVATNSFTTAETSVQMFRTSESGLIYIMCSFCTSFTTVILYT